MPANLLMAFALIFAGIATVLGLAFDNVASMIDTWSRDSAYNHCWIILPIAGFLAWERRGRVKGLRPQVFWPGFILLAGFTFAWVVARGAAIVEGQQFALIGMILSLFLIILGRKICRAQILPLLYLFLLVPSGSFMLPYLQYIATKSTLFLLSFTSIPIFAEQFYIHTPVGLFFIAPGCAGLNFILAAISLSIVYAELMFVGWLRKLACIVIWVLVAIIANGVRIFAILVLAQITDEKLAIVDDHLLYGWGFFIVILFIMMAVGRRFSNYTPHVIAPPAPIDQAPARLGNLIAAGISAIAVISIPVGYTRAALAPGKAIANLGIDIPQTIGKWKLMEEEKILSNGFRQADLTGVWRYRMDSEPVDLVIGYYWDQWDGHEAASSANNSLGPADAQVVRRLTAARVINGKPRQLREQLIRVGLAEYILWSWYCTGNVMTDNPFTVQMLTSKQKLQRREAPATIITLLTREGQGAHERLETFLMDLAASDESLRIRQPGSDETRAAVCW